MGSEDEFRRSSNWKLDLSCSTSSGFISAMLLVLILFVATSSATTLSFPEEIMAQSTGRRLLQALKPCPVSFENMNYTIITSRCKGPKYPSQTCCTAFKDFACPYTDQLNDLTNNCANTMFSYINLYGKYPPGLFANECRDSKRGLECTPAQLNPPHSTSSAAPQLSVLLLSVAAFAFAFAFAFGILF